MEKGEVEEEQAEALGLWLLDGTQVRAGRFPAGEPTQEAHANDRVGRGGGKMEHWWGESGKAEF